MRAAVYQDYVHNNGVLFRRLCESFGPAQVSFCDAHDIQNGALDHVQILVMPGGADLYNCEKLDGRGNALIRTFVENGGVYLGICAGAYYACNAIEWGIGTAQEITGPRELAFFEGTATGPVTDFIEDGNIDKSWKEAVMIDGPAGPDTLLYDGGPVFSEPENSAVLARYTDLPGQPPAMTETLIGHGCVILSGPHIEYGPNDLARALCKHQNASYEREKAVADVLQTGPHRTWDAIINRIAEQDRHKHAA